MICKKVFLLGILLLCFDSLFAQKSQLTRKLNEATKLGLAPYKAISQYQCDVWQKDKGLPQNSVFAITQSKDGFLWIATYEGLARFDGLEFSTFNTTNVNELLTSGVWEIFEDSQENVWLGTNNGGLTKISKGKFKTYTIEDGLPSNTVSEITETKDKTIWIGTKQGLVAHKDGLFKSYGTVEGLSSKEITCLYVGNSEKLWIGTNRGISAYHQGKFEDYSRNRILLFNKNITAISEDDKGFLWIGTQAGLVRWNEKTGTSKIFRIADGLTDDYISKLWYDSRGTLWIGTQGGGLNRIINQDLASENPKISAFTVREGLSANSVTELYEDFEGSLWIGLNRGGLNRLRDGKFTNYTSKEGLTDNVTNCVFEDKEGGIWIGTVSGGVSYFKNGVFRSFHVENGLSNNYVRSITQDKNGDIWIATYGGGVNQMLWSQNKTNPRIIHYSTREGLAGNIARSVIQSKSGAMWIGTKTGLSKLEKGKFTNYTKQMGLSDNSVICVFEDSQGNIWAGTDGFGLNCIRPDNSIIIYTTRKGLANNLVFCIYEDKKGVIWAGTKGGLSRIKNGEIVSIYAKDGLASDAVHSLIEDKLGRLWMSCNSGVFWANKAELETFADNFSKKNTSSSTSKRITSVIYAEEDGMKSSDCAASAQPTGIIDRNGLLWFPTTEGISTIDPVNIKINYKKPPVVIKNFEADNVSYSFFGERLYFEAGISKFEIDYAALSFLAPNKTHYRYKLVGDGFKEDWIDARNKRDTYYTNLPPGNYTFKVQARNHDNVWNEEGAEIQFYLQPLFYQTRLFYILIISLSITALLLAYYLRIRVLEIRQKALQKGIEESTQMIRQQYQEINQQAEELKTINNIVRTINQEVKFENVLKLLLEQGLLLFPQSEKGIFLLYKPADEVFELVATVGYDFKEFEPKTFSQEDVLAYCETGIKLDENLYKLQPAINLKKLASQYRPKSSVAMEICTDKQTEGVIFFDNTSGYQDVQTSDIQKLIRFKEHAVSAFLKARILQEIEIKNLQIESSFRKISDSIRYARRIQTAILSKEDEIADNFEDAFILYKPKDIVSGDFYWYAETQPEGIYEEAFLNDKKTSVFKGFQDVQKLIAAVDCTGHGVPGAFMTVIGNDLLNAIVLEQKIYQPNKILELLDRSIKNYLKQEEGSQSRDGMDMALLLIDEVKKTIYFSGAKNPLYYIRHRELFEIKGSKFPIGGARIQKKNFELHEIPYEEGDVFYMLSDGFQDQFGVGTGKSHEKKYTSRRVKEFLLMIHQLPLSKQKDALDQELTQWMGDSRQTDDILVIGLKF